jgi:superoxide dismutase, Cu-Zn family
MPADGGVRVTGTLVDIPAGPHGMHIHDVGSCEGPTFESAGAHLNPAHRQHGLDNPEGPHLGDGPNVGADAANEASVDVIFRGVMWNGSAPMSLFDANGSAIVIHESRDDQRTDPSGSSGARIACGVVEPKT